MSSPRVHPEKHAQAENECGIAIFYLKKKAIFMGGMFNGELKEAKYSKVQESSDNYSVVIWIWQVNVAKR